MRLFSSHICLFRRKRKNSCHCDRSKRSVRGLSYLDAVAEGKANAAVGVDRCMIQQLSPGLRIESRHPLLQSVQGADELLRCCLGGNQGGDRMPAGGFAAGGFRTDGQNATLGSRLGVAGRWR